MEPIEMSQRPPQLPAVIVSQPGVCQSTAMSLPSLAERRLTVSSAVEGSKPSYLPVVVLRNENGFEVGSGEMRILPDEMIFPRSDFWSMDSSAEGAADAASDAAAAGDDVAA